MEQLANVTQWIEQLDSDDNSIFNEAARHLAEWAQPMLQNLARRRLPAHVLRRVGEEEVCQAALFTFFRRCRGGEFNDLSGREKLKALLCTITGRKACNTVEHEEAQMRDAKLDRELQTSGDPTASDARRPGTPLAPEDPVILEETFEEMLALLGNPKWQAAIRLRAEGMTTERIAKKLDRTPRTIQRWLEQAEQQLFGEH